MVPPDLRGRLDGPQIFHEVLVHRWLLAERAGHDVGIFDACQDYIDHVLVDEAGRGDRDGRRRPDGAHGVRSRRWGIIGACPRPPQQASPPRAPAWSASPGATGCTRRAPCRSASAARPSVPVGPLRMYTCGITPYDVTHVGHASTFVWADLVALGRACRRLGLGRGPQRDRRRRRADPGGADQGLALRRARADPGVPLRPGHAGAVRGVADAHAARPRRTCPP